MYLNNFNFFPAPIDIQSILNGAAKFCRHCDVVILNSLIRKKVSDLPFLSKEEAESGEELYFCSAGCYMQFALMHRTPVNIQDKAATIVDHLYQKSQTKMLDDELRKIHEKKLYKQTTGLEKMDVDPSALHVDSAEFGIKLEKMDHGVFGIRDEFDEKRAKKHSVNDDVESLESQPPVKLWKGVRYKTWMMGAIQATTKYKKPTDREITEVFFDTYIFEVLNFRQLNKVKRN